MHSIAERATVLDRNRLDIIATVIRNRPIGNQQELADLLSRKGVETTQSSISRDLKKLGVVKVSGRYQLPQISTGESPVVDRLDATLAGPNLIVLKTGPGNANRAALLIDNAAITGLLGTIAGDDTIFIAVASEKDQPRVLKRVFALFQSA